MVNAALYSQTNSISRQAAIQCLEEYAAKLKWKETGETIIDLGCGDGSVSCILKLYVPKNYAQFVACDINEKAIEYAKEHHADENIVFRTLDMAGDIPDELKFKFNHVFSFFLINWIHDQEKAFNNVYELMSPGGECLLTIAGYNPFTYLFDAIAQDKNSSGFQGFGKPIPTQYLYLKNTEEYVTELMKKIGFMNMNVRLTKQRFNFKNVMALKKFVKALEPYGIPDDLYDEYFQKFITTGVDKGIFDEQVTDMNDVKTEVQIEYDMCIVYAYKPYN